MLHGASPRGFLRLKFMKKDPFLQKDCSDHQIFTGNGLNTGRCLAFDDDTGIFFGKDKVVIKTADTAIVLGNGQIKLDGSVTKSQIIDSSVEVLLKIQYLQYFQALCQLRQVLSHIYQTLVF